MLRTLNVILVALMLAGAGAVYLMKYDNDRASGRITKLQRQIADTRLQISGLRAEWSLLNQPRRIQELVEKYHDYLGLDPLDPTQVANIEDIPMRPQKTPGADAPDPAKPQNRMLAVGKAGDVTGALPKKGSETARGKTSDKSGEKPPAVTMPKSFDPKPNDPINALIR